MKRISGLYIFYTERVTPEIHSWNLKGLCLNRTHAFFFLNSQLPSGFWIERASSVYIFARGEEKKSVQLYKSVFHVLRRHGCLDAHLSNRRFHIFIMTCTSLIILDRVFQISRPRKRSFLAFKSNEIWKKRGLYMFYTEQITPKAHEI